MAKILNFGSLNIDYVYHVDDFVKPGETKLSNSLKTYGGGKGNNQSIALARAGANVYHAGQIGQDGQFLVNNLKSEGVNVDYIRTSPNLPSGHAIIQVNAKGENNILLHGGANQEITAEYIEQVLNNFNAQDILLIQNEISNLDKLIELAARKQMTIYFNPAPMDKKVLNYPLHHIDTFIVNQTEAKALTSGTSTDEVLAEMKELFPFSKIILTLGNDGVIYQNGSTTIHQPAYQAQAVDTTAAGDTFLGYFIASLQKNMSTEQALNIACLAASISVTRQGATTSIPYLKELEQAQILSTK